MAHPHDEEACALEVPQDGEEVALPRVQDVPEEEVRSRVGEARA